jgi:hypothetical protein
MYDFRGNKLTGIYLIEDMDSAIYDLDSEKGRLIIVPRVQPDMDWLVRDIVYIGDMKVGAELMEDQTCGRTRLAHDPLHEELVGDILTHTKDLWVIYTPRVDVGIGWAR